jgi:hypothetical protein
MVSGLANKGFQAKLRQLIEAPVGTVLQTNQPLSGCLTPLATRRYTAFFQVLALRYISGII